MQQQQQGTSANDQAVPRCDVTAEEEKAKESREEKELVSNLSDVVARVSARGTSKKTKIAIRTLNKKKKIVGRSCAVEWPAVIVAERKAEI